MNMRKLINIVEQNDAQSYNKDWNVTDIAHVGDGRNFSVTAEHNGQEYTMPMHIVVYELDRAGKFKELFSFDIRSPDGKAHHVSLFDNPKEGSLEDLIYEYFYLHTSKKYANELNQMAQDESELTNKLEQLVDSGKISKQEFISIRDNFKGRWPELHGVNNAVNVPSTKIDQYSKDPKAQDLSKNKKLH